MPKPISSISVSSRARSSAAASWGRKAALGCISGSWLRPLVGRWCGHRNGQWRDGQRAVPVCPRVCPMRAGCRGRWVCQPRGARRSCPGAWRARTIWRDAALFLAPVVLAAPFIAGAITQQNDIGAFRFVLGWSEARIGDGPAAVAFFYATNLGIPVLLALIEAGAARDDAASLAHRVADRRGVRALARAAGGGPPTVPDDNRTVVLPAITPLVIRA